MVSLGVDAFHAEAVVQEAEQLGLYVLGADETQLQEVTLRTLTAYAKPLDGQSGCRLRAKRGIPGSPVVKKHYTTRLRTKD